MKKAVEVKFYAWRDKDVHTDWWVGVKAIPQEPEQVESIRILYYQYSPSDEIQGIPFTSYEMENGTSYGWDINYGDIIMIFVHYRDKRYGEQVAAQGVWWSDGYHLRSGHTLCGRSELFA